ncbi:SusC/RagA family TonB-linked outer membrane protein [Mucilaginibacter aquaedulcis]|uniref:SusC/RagA family TonB-linked outer membrane protein n=1 Tax=Mucilaginibacter aquaedulcis TaxID=1187081 RepID=UPI0025B60B1C|nr:SusC/RagA family TonB-linked outer membrane protein [Mucilaginibacter aquaedulcis]MDN3548845.1 SusC/RagA family TonB-linked outer membrane protein [Mucilaginibacter aquaedulcis]
MMKLTIILLVAGLMQVSAATFGQRLTLKGRNVSVEKVFRAISDQTGYDVVVFTSKFKTTQVINVDFKDTPLEEVIQKLIAGTTMTFSIEDKTVVIREKKPLLTDQTDLQTALITVKGKVLNEEGHPLPGATVIIKGKTRGVLTNADGEFSLSEVDSKAVLVISYTGYEPIETQASKEVKVYKLKIKVASLDEVVVTNGYQRIERRKLTSAITSVKAADITNPAFFTIDQALEGRIPGLFVLNNSGDIGVSPKIRIRGTSTILGSREPIWVVDGVVVNDPVGIDPATINDLDFVNRLGNAISGLKPFDIDQIDVLKDASATALYGVRAANGVIVITTKKGKAGDPVVNFNQSTILTKRPRYTDGNIRVMNSRQRIDYSRDIINSGLEYSGNINYVGYEGTLNNLYNGRINYSQFQSAVQKMETMNTDWFGTILKDAISTQNNISVSGGGAKMTYYASVGAATQQGTVRGDKTDQYTALVKLTAALTPRLSWDMTLRGNNQKSDYVAGAVNALSYAYNTSRAVPAFNEDGTLSYYQKYTPGDSRTVNYFGFNILNEMQHSRDLINTSGVNLLTDLNVKVNPYLNGTVLLSYSNNNSNDQTVYQENTFYAASLRRSEFGSTAPTTSLMPFGGEMLSNQVRNESYLVRGQLNYDRPVGSASRDNLNITIGGELSSNRYKGYNIDRRGYLPDRGQTYAPVDPLKYPAYAQWATLNDMDIVRDALTNLASGYFSSSYTINDKYILNFNTRTDFSNKFGSRSKEKFLPTWSVSGRWDIDKDLFKNSKSVNLLALKTSYGFQGNMLENQTPNLIIKQGSIDPITQSYYSNIAYYPNPNLKWEKNKEFNVGLDFGFFHNKIQGTVNYFNKTTNNAFLSKEVADINGVTSYIVNSGTIKNQGIEVTLSFTPINNLGPNGKKGGFSWRIDPQLGQVINKLLSKSINSLNVGDHNPNVYNNYLTGSQIVDDKASNTFYSYHFTGLDHLTGLPTFANNDPSMADKYKGMSLDDVIKQVMVPSGNRIPTLQGGLLNVFSYRQFSLSCNMTYSVGSKVRLQKLYSNTVNGIVTSTVSAPLPENNVNLDFVNRWRKPGDEAYTNIPSLVGGTAYANTLSHWSASGSNTSFQYADNIWQMYDNSDARIASGNYLKLRTLNFRYSLSDALTKRLKIKQTSVMFSATNVHTWASKKLEGQDPEQLGFGDNTQLSPRSTYSITLDVSF